MKRLTAISFLLGLCCLFGSWSASAQTDTEVKTATSDSTSGFSVVDILSNPLLTVRGDGNTGIGTSTPTATLDVNGTAQIDDWKTQSLSPVAGYAQMGSILIQWGEVHNNCVPSSCTHNFPIPFPNQVFQAVGTLSNQVAAVRISVLSNSSFATQVPSGTPNVSWIAIGY